MGRMSRSLCLAGAIALLVSGCASGPRSYPLNERAMYGGVEGDEAMRQADQKLIEGVLATGNTRWQGSVHAANRGFEFFFKGDYATARKRFNQAWLLDPENPGAYHGFAVVASERDKDLAFAESMFGKALALPTATPGTYADFGLLLIRGNRHAEAVQILEKGALLDPDLNHVTLRRHLAVALIGSGQTSRGCAEARRAIERANDEETSILKKLMTEYYCTAAG